MARSYVKQETGGQGRIPLEHFGLQVNFCRNPACANFGVPPLSAVDLGRAAKISDGYRRVGSKDSEGVRDNLMSCKLCSQSFVLKSNRAVIEEFERQKRAYVLPERITCTNQECGHSKLTLLAGTDVSKHYQQFGRTAAGSLRYRCKACKKTFSVTQSSTIRQRKPEITETILKLLVNKVPMRRICEVAEVLPAVLYNRIGFIYKQTQHYAAAQEAPLIKGKHFELLRIAVDRQDHVFNWASSADRRNTKLSAVASADCESGYVFGMELDFDPRFSPYEIDLEARSNGDYKLAPPYRQFARFFLPGDYDHGQKPVEPESQLEDGVKLPGLGMRVHAEYMIMGHFQWLRWLLPNVDLFHLYLDQEPSIRGACLAAFMDLIAQRRVEAFFVRIGKNLTIDERKTEIAKSESYLAKLQLQYPNLTRWKIAKSVMTARYEEARRTHASVTDRWVESILPHMGEPKKALCYLTDHGAVDPAMVASAMLKASLHPVDRFFMQLRRRISLLERPISTASSTGRTWHGYNAYNPENAARVMKIFRVIFNYCLVGKDGKTPAMRLGLASRPTTYKELIAYI